MDNQILYKIGISLIPGVGCVNARKLIAYVGSIEGVFTEKQKNLLKIPGIGESVARAVVQSNVLDRAKEEIEFIEKNSVKTYFYLDKEYPERLKNCMDAPLLLYVKGDIDFNNPKSLALVGTRNATNYGKEICDTLIAKINERKHNALIVSGLAYGIDIWSHKAAIKNKLQTIAVLGHGLETVYPSLHKNAADEISKSGALVSEFVSNTRLDKSNFVKRNRIIAGLSDATIVVESGEKGGALITADIANSYNRDVFVFPGRTNDQYSKGCNKLIKTNKANLIEGVEDIEYFLNWPGPDEKKAQKAIQRELFVVMSDDERLIIDLLQKNGDMMIDKICNTVSQPVSKISPVLLNLEFSGLIKALPGNVYRAL